jgi:hypothetical protein
MTDAEINKIEQKVEKYLNKRSKYFQDVNKIREDEYNHKKFPWDADFEIKELDIDLNASIEKKEYNDLVKRIDTEDGFEEIFRGIHSSMIRK